MADEYSQDTKEKKEKKYLAADIAQKAIDIVDGERKRWMDSVSFVTDRVAFQMRNLIRVLRKNYWGVYDIPRDPMTGRDKVWIPLSRTMVEGVVKNIDLDTKDISFRAKNDKGYNITKLIRALVRKFLDAVFFGETLDEMERALAIDGTVVWKFIEGRDAKGRPKLIRKNVDLLNVYIDPTEDNIQSAFRFTERGLMLPSEIEQMTGWINRKETGGGTLLGSKMISRIDGQYTPISQGTTANYRDVWEMWGKIPQSLITGKYDPDGDDDLIDGHIVVSGLDVRDPKCHLIEKNLKADAEGNILKPYEEVRYAKVSNRWYGLGVCERLLMLQIWMNTIVNIRINRAYVSQLGLFKIRKGAGITPQMLSRLGANGAIVVNDVNDLVQMEMQEASQASYTDEKNIIDWGQRDTGAFDVSVGEPTPSSKPATTSVLENNSAKSGFKLVKDAIGSFLERCIDRHMLHIIANGVDVGELIEVSDKEDIEPLIDSIIAEDAMKALEAMYAKGIVPSQEKLQQAMETAKEKLVKRDNIFIKLVKKLISSHVYTKVFVTNEEMDPSVVVQNIISVMKMVPPEAQMPLVKEAMDLMGIDFNLPKPQPQQSHQDNVKQSMNFKDLPDEGRVQMAAEAGIKLNPAVQNPVNPEQPTGSVTPRGQGVVQSLQRNNPQPLVTGANVLHR